MTHGRFSDGDKVRTKGEDNGVIVSSLGHWKMTGRQPDTGVGPRYLVRLTTGKLVILQDEDLSAA